MNFSDFVTEDEMADLSENDSVAFVEFVKLAEPRLRTELAKYESRENDQWQMIEDAAYSFQNVVQAAAKQFDVSPFNQWNVGIRENYSWQTYLSFRAELDSTMTQLMLFIAPRGRKDSIQLPEDLKVKIRTRLNGLRECVQSSTLDVKRKKQLLDKLAEFDDELNRRKIRYGALAMVVLQIISVPGSAWGSAEIANKLIREIAEQVEVVKVEQDARSKIEAPHEPAKLAAPRREATSGAPAFHLVNNDRDDDIPF